MLKLMIKSENGTYECNRFDSPNLRVGDTLRLSTTPNSISVLSARFTSWEELYNAYISERTDNIFNIINNEIKPNRVTSINNLINDVYLLAGRGIAIEQKKLENRGYIGLCSTLYNTSIDQKFAQARDIATINNALNDIMRYQMCIYHYLNVPIHRVLTTTGSYAETECPYGSYLRYLSIKARWNYYVFMSWFNCNIVGGSDNISMAVGINNIFAQALGASVVINITANSTTNYMIWHGIFLEETSTLNTNVTANNINTTTTDDGETESTSFSGDGDTISYKIERIGGYCYQLKNKYYTNRWEGIEAEEIREDYALLDQQQAEAEEEDPDAIVDRRTRAEAFTERVFYPTPERLSEPSGIKDHNNPKDDTAYDYVEAPVDITNPNACIWSNYGGSWTAGKITIHELTLNPGQSFKQVYSIARHPAVGGYTTRDIPVLFNIDVVLKIGDYEITRKYENISCYMHRPAPASSIKNKSSDPVYILTATDNMSIYTDPMPQE